MKKLYPILLFFCVITYSQELIKLTESSGGIEMCGYTVSVDKIYTADNNLKADIYFSKGGTGKPFSGGYGKGDMIDLGSDCHWFVHAIDKPEGRIKGDVYLSPSKPETIEINNSDTLYLSQFNEYKLNNEIFYFSEAELYGEEKFSIDVYSSVQNNKPILTSFNEGESVWFGTGKYKIENIYLRTPRGLLDKNVVIPFTVFLVRQYEDSPQYFIRKMKYYPKKKVNEEEYANTPVEIYLLKVNYSPGPMAMQIMQVNTSSGKQFHPFSIEKTFKSEEEALSYAKENNILDINFKYFK